MWAILKVGGNDEGDPCVMAMSNHCFGWCQTLSHLVDVVLEKGE